MKLVKSIKDIEKNLITFENYNNSLGSSIIEKYKSLIKKGTCFVVYKCDDQILFSPSRFVGYKNITLKKHQESNTLNGTETNKAISEILDEKPKINKNIENHYSYFCKKLGIKANKLGSFGIPRKYWLMPNTDILYDIENVKDDGDVRSTEKETLIKARKGQGKYRKSLIEYWKSCAVTNCENVHLLRASHIKPWQYSKDEERLDLYNGILLSPNYDLLFDQGFITFNNSGKIEVSNALCLNDISSLNINKSAKIKLENSHMKYIKFHRKYIYKKP